MTLSREHILRCTRSRVNVNGIGIEDVVILLLLVISFLLYNDSRAVTPADTLAYKICD